MELRYEPRKVQSIGSSLFISLPFQWTRTLGLKHGDKIIIVIQDDSSLRLEVER